jgi:hypothetical protein
MADLKDPRLIYAKGFLFLLTGSLASVLLVCEHPSWQVVCLLAIAVWSFARFYYFAFYVIEHYVDPGYHFAGLWDFAKYLLTRQSGGVTEGAARPGSEPAKPAGADSGERHAH